MNVTSFAQKAGVSRDAMNKWFKQEELRIRPDLLLTLLQLLRIDDRQIRDSISDSQAMKKFPLEGQELVDLQYGLTRKIMANISWMMQESPEFNDRSVEPYSEIPLPGEIPTFEMSVAAGPWADVTDIAEVHQPGQIDHGLFRIRIAGESMKPNYKTGMVIEFQCLREGRDKLFPGRDYYVQRRDGTATFKRLKEIYEERLVLHALNQRVCKGTMEVQRAEITRMAIARGEFRAFDGVAA